MGVNYTDTNSRSGANPPARLPWIRRRGRRTGGRAWRGGHQRSRRRPGGLRPVAGHLRREGGGACRPARPTSPGGDRADGGGHHPAGNDGARAGLRRLQSEARRQGPGARRRRGRRAPPHPDGQTRRRVRLRHRRHGREGGAGQDAGADEVILYSQEDFEEAIRKSTDGEGVNVIYDAVGQSTFEKGFNCLAPLGHMLLYGQASGPVGPLNTRILGPGSYYLSRPGLGNFTRTRGELEQRAGDVLQWVQSGDLKLHIHAVMPLKDASEAHRQLGGRETSGKLVLTPSTGRGPRGCARRGGGQPTTAGAPPTTSNGSGGMDEWIRVTARGLRLRRTSRGRLSGAARGWGAAARGRAAIGHVRHRLVPAPDHVRVCPGGLRDRLSGPAGRRPPSEQRGGPAGEELAGPGPGCAADGGSGGLPPKAPLG